MVNKKFFQALVYVIIIFVLIIFFLIQPYNLFCHITKNCHPIIFSSLLPHRIGKKKLLINFTAQKSLELENIIEFYPQENSLEITSGKNIINFYNIKNLTNKKIAVIMAYNIIPAQADKYLDKIECLCFKKHVLEAGEILKMPINFRINPAIEKEQDIKDLKGITINYKVKIL